MKNFSELSNLHWISHEYWVLLVRILDARFFNRISSTLCLYRVGKRLSRLESEGFVVARKNDDWYDEILNKNPISEMVRQSSYDRDEYFLNTCPTVFAGTGNFSLGFFFVFFFSLLLFVGPTKVLEKIQARLSYRLAHSNESARSNSPFCLRVIARLR